MRTVTALAIALSALGLCLPASGDDPKKPPSEEAVAALIAQLGSPDFDKREEAARRLAELPEALGPLRRAAENEKNPEVARRVREILPVLTRRVGAEKLKRLPGYAKERQLDRMVESLVAWREAVSIENRKVPRALAEDILGWAKKEFGPGVPNLFVSGIPPKEYAAGGKRRPRGAKDWITDAVEPDDKGRGVRVKGDGLITFESSAPLGYTNGDFAYLSSHIVPIGGLIVCNGGAFFDVGVITENAVIICTGTAQFKFVVNNSLVVAGGDIVMADDVKQASLKSGAVLRPNEKKVAEFFRLYDAAAEGLHVRIQDKNVFVERVDADKPFAKAGVQAGDRIIRVNDVVVRDVRGLNRLLCRAEVGHPGTAVLSLARGEKGVEAVVKLVN